MTDNPTPNEIARKLSKAQSHALLWLVAGNVAASDAFHGHSKEQPRRRTLDKLVSLYLAEVEITNRAWFVSATAQGIEAAM